MPRFLSAHALTVSGFLLISASALAQTPPAPGTYVTKGGWGTLEIGKNKDGGLSFAIESIGANAHLCVLDGNIVNGTATLEGADDQTCTITFTQKGGTVTVDPVISCRYHCGQRASFDGDYLTPPPGCSPAEVQKARDTFTRLYKGKDYAAARTTLEPVLQNCSATLRELEVIAPIRNDLAVTYHKLGDTAACRAVLEPYREDAAKKDENIENYSFAPYERESYADIIKAVRFNLALCEKAGKKK